MLYYVLTLNLFNNDNNNKYNQSNIDFRFGFEFRRKFNWIRPSYLNLLKLQQNTRTNEKKNNSYNNTFWSWNYREICTANYAPNRRLFIRHINILLIYRIMFCSFRKTSSSVFLQSCRRSTVESVWSTDVLISIHSMNFWISYDFLYRWILCVDGPEFRVRHF